MSTAVHTDGRAVYVCGRLYMRLPTAKLAARAARRLLRDPALPAIVATLSKL